MNGRQQDLFVQSPLAALPVGYKAMRPEHFQVERIFLAKGCLDTAEREAFVRRVCNVYAEVPVSESLDTPHDQVDAGGQDDLKRQTRGKRTLVIGELNPKSAVRRTKVDDCVQPFRWHFSVYSYCFYGCSYCYLAGTNGVWHSPTVRIYVNLPEIMDEIHRQAMRLAAPVSFYLGRLQDGLALDPLTAYSTVLVPFFAAHRYARLAIQTKSASVDRLLPLEHKGHTVLSWSLNTPEISGLYEQNVPSIDERISAMARCAQASYPVRAVIQPFVPEGDWEEGYSRLVCALLDRVPHVEVSVAGMCIGNRALSLLERRKGQDNSVSRNLMPPDIDALGRRYYRPHLENRLFGAVCARVQRRHPTARIAYGRQYPSELRALRVALPDVVEALS